VETPITAHLPLLDIILCLFIINKSSVYVLYLVNFDMKSARDIPRLLRGAYLAMHRSTNAHLARLGVTADQFVLLCVLAEGNAFTQRDLARRSFSDPNTIRPMLKSLEGRGLLSRQRHPQDGRAMNVKLTAKGLKTWKKLIAASEPVRERLADAFRPADIPTLLDFLCRMAKATDLPISDGTGSQRAASVKKETLRRKPAGRNR
jgi:MarR family transcriptional regulator, organic hydroperoxide resistance regulator